MEPQNRRSLLKNACSLGVAASIGAVASPLTGCGSGSADAASPPAEYLYSPLDVEAARKRGHFEYESGLECCEGAFKAIIGLLDEKVGAPFTGFPTKMMRYGAGGIAGFATLCGALNGSCAAISLMTEAADAKALAAELLSWYAQEPLPTDQSNYYAVNHEFEAPEYMDIEIPQSVAGGNLCHQSVTNWCTTNGYASGCPERHARCGRLCGDVAAKAVELLNAHYDENFVSAYPLPADAAGCRACHKKGTDAASGQFTRGKMDCRTCHVEPTITDH